MNTKKINFKDCLNDSKDILSFILQTKSVAVKSLFDGVYGEIQTNNKVYCFIVAANLIRFNHEAPENSFPLVAPILYLLSLPDEFPEVIDAFKKAKQDIRLTGDIADKTIKEFNDAFLRCYSFDFESLDFDIQESALNTNIVQGAANDGLLEDLTAFEDVDMPVMTNVIVSTSDKDLGLKYTVKDNEVSIQEIDNNKITSKVVLPEIINGFPVIKLDENLFAGNNIIETLIIPDTVRSIGASACKKCENLKYVHLPNAIEDIEEEAFSGCISLSEISFPEGLTQIKANAFENCLGLKTLSFPKSLSKIHNSAFRNCISLQQIKMEEGIVVIDDNAFANCKSLLSVNLPNSLETISFDAFPLNAKQNIKMQCNQHSYAAQWLYDIYTTGAITPVLTNGKIEKKEPQMELAKLFFENDDLML